MLNSLYISALGMQAQKSQLDAVSNNLVNANTMGYKRERVDFSSVLDRQAAEVGPGGSTNAPDPSADANPTGIGWVKRDLSQGQLTATGSVLDLAINGSGFMEVQLSNDKLGYIRGGSLKVNADGYITTKDGNLLKSDIRIPANSSNLQIDNAGNVTAQLAGAQQTTNLGRLPLVSFANPDSLNYLGNGIYENPVNQTEPARGNPGEDGFGVIESGKLEASNVSLVDETVSLMTAQRIYELNSRVVQAADEIMQLTNNLRRG